jgi:thiol-disulfide isomerase/thioredoxin
LGACVLPPSAALGQNNGLGQAAAPDFPPGAFSDMSRHSLADYKGKVVVLFFFEDQCPTCRGLIPKRNEVVEQFKNAPVKFIAVGAHDTTLDVRSYLRDTHLEMTTFVDNLNIMETLYNQRISLKNIYQFRVIGPNGAVVGYDMDPKTIQAAVDQVKLQYDPKEYDPRLADIVNLLEWNQYPAALRQLKPLRRSATRALAASADKLYAAALAHGQQWKDQADQALESDPVVAYDLYTQVAQAFAGDPLAKSVAAPLRKLKLDKAVKNELAARGLYDQLYDILPRVTNKQKPQAVEYIQNIITKYPDTPTAKKAQAIADAIAKAPDDTN